MALLKHCLPITKIIFYTFNFFHHLALLPLYRHEKLFFKVCFHFQSASPSLWNRFDKTLRICNYSCHPYNRIQDLFLSYLWSYRYCSLIIKCKTWSLNLSNKSLATFPKNKYFEQQLFWSTNLQTVTKITYK